jgi:tetratricopeptide (TPR) repeat protein
MRSALVLLTLVCLALVHTGCNGGANSANGANSATTNAARPNETSLPPLPANADARAYFERGLEAYKKNLDREAVEAFEQAVRLEPEFAASHYRLGLAYAAVGRSEDAEKSFEAAVKWFKEEVKGERENAESQFYLGLAYAKLDNNREAVRAFRQAVRLAPDSEKYYELGVAHSKLAEYSEAVNALEKAVELDPNNYRAADALVDARAGLVRRQNNLKALEKMRQRKANQNANVSSGPASTPTP